MVDHWLLRVLLIPVSLLFGLAAAMKNILYRIGVFNSIRFDVPIIAVGNLSVGGAGKTPHVEYLLRLLSPYVKAAVMSRGYGRDTSGFILVSPGHQSDQSGDEPLIYARKFKDLPVAVSESRSVGIPLLLQHHPATQVVVLDDAYQHRSVHPYVNILLTEYGDPYYQDWLLPVGRLREWRTASARADIIIVTKCPVSLTIELRDDVLVKLSPQPHQTVYFSAYQYHQPYSVYQPYPRIKLSELDSALIVCGIAKPEVLQNYVAGVVDETDLLAFRDHHAYQEADLHLMERRYTNLPGPNKALITTEKDIVRLEPYGSFFAERKLPVFILPLEVAFLFQQGAAFDRQVQQLLLDFKI
jgi:tetraacyldisaccharide 4'-kinase